jgi:hypothetical protein
VKSFEDLEGMSVVSYQSSVGVGSHKSGPAVGS